MDTREQKQHRVLLHCVDEGRRKGGISCFFSPFHVKISLKTGAPLIHRGETASESDYRCWMNALILEKKKERDGALL